MAASVKTPIKIYNLNEVCFVCGFLFNSVEFNSNGESTITNQNYHKLRITEQIANNIEKASGKKVK